MNVNNLCCINYVNPVGNKHFIYVLDIIYYPFYLFEEVPEKFINHKEIEMLVINNCITLGNETEKKEKKRKKKFCSCF